MGMGTGGGGGTIKTPSYKLKGEKLTRALVIDEVKIVEEERVYEVPRVSFKDQEQIKLVNKEQEQIKYNTRTEETTRYIPKEETTIKYVPKEEPTTRYVVEDVKVERPVPVDKFYEKPVINKVEYNLVTFKDLEAIQKALELMPLLIENLNATVAKLAEVKDFKLVEKEVEVQRIIWKPVEAERIIWKDVERERVK